MTDTNPLPPYDWPQLQPGWVWLCGAGPGDAGLLTLHALNALRQADVIVYDALVGEAILDWASDDAELIYAGKRGGKPSAKQRDISLQLVDFARAGKRVLRLKGGDPFVFGRGGEEAQTLIQHDVPVRIIPGISAGIGGLALLAAGRAPDEPVAVVTNATLPHQQVLETTLSTIQNDLAAANMSPPAIICVGKSVLMRQVLDWQGLSAGEKPRNLDPLNRGRPAEVS